MADARGLLGFADGSQNIGVDRHELIFTGAEAPEWARGGSYLAVRLIRLKLERWDRLSRTAQERLDRAQEGLRRAARGNEGGGGAEARLAHAVDAHIRMANPRKPGDERHRFLRRPVRLRQRLRRLRPARLGLGVHRPSAATSSASSRTVKRRTHGQDLDEYMVAFGGGYFFCPPGVEGEGDYLARRLVEPA